MKKKTKQDKKISKVMREFKKGKLPIGKSKKKVKSRKQAIAEGDTECEEVVKVTQVCLYDTSGELTAIGTPTQIIDKTDNYVGMNLSVKLDGGIGNVWGTKVNPAVSPSK